MGRYTDSFSVRLEYIDDADDYVEELISAEQTFRDLGEGMDEFILSHGYTGDIEDVHKKAKFIRGRFRDADIDIKCLRNITKWFTEGRWIEKETAIKICFAFGLDIMESEDFLRRICLMRGFDCHRPDELVLYHAIRDGFDYDMALKEIMDLPKPDSLKIMPDRAAATGSIVDETEDITELSELVSYIRTHMDRFAYRNVTSYANIKELWYNISRTGGLAETELRLKYVQLSDEDGRGVRQRKIGDNDQFYWRVYTQILGLYGSRIKSLGTDDTIKPILRNREFLSRHAEEMFPNKQTLEKINRGEKVKDEAVRKTLILLSFYTFWVSHMLACGSYEAAGNVRERSYHDARSCIASINLYLLDSGYPELYRGNPYDWIFIYSSFTPYPLVTFRDFMRELFERYDSPESG